MSKSRRIFVYFLDLILIIESYLLAQMLDRPIRITSK